MSGTDSISASELRTYQQSGQDWMELNNVLPKEISGSYFISGPVDTAPWGISFSNPTSTREFSPADVRPALPYMRSAAGRLLYNRALNLVVMLAKERVALENTRIPSENVSGVLGNWFKQGFVLMDSFNEKISRQEEEEPAEKNFSTARFLLKHATGWAGDDLEERLGEVYRERSKTVL